MALTQTHRSRQTTHAMTIPPSSTSTQTYDGGTSTTIGRNTTKEGTTGTANKTGLIVGCSIGGFVFLALLIVAIVFLVRRYGRPTKTRLQKAMKSSLKDAAKNGSLLPSYREPAFAHPHTPEVHTKTLERVDVKPQTKPNGVFGVHYSATNQAVDIREIDASVYDDPLLNMALAQGSSSKSKQGIAPNTHDWTLSRQDKDGPGFSVDYTTATPEEYSYVDADEMDTGLPAEKVQSPSVQVDADGLIENSGNNRSSQPQNPEYLELVDSHPENHVYSETYSRVNPAFVGESGKRQEQDSKVEQQAGDHAYEGLDTRLEPNVYTKLDVQNLSGTHSQEDSVYALETPEAAENEVTPHIDQYSSDNVYSLCQDHGNQDHDTARPEPDNEYSLEQNPAKGEGLPSKDGLASGVNHTEYSLAQSPKAGPRDQPDQQPMDQDSDAYQSAYSFPEPQDRPNLSNSETGESECAVYDASHRVEQTCENESGTNDNPYALYDDSHRKEPTEENNAEESKSNENL